MATTANALGMRLRDLRLERGLATRQLAQELTAFIRQHDPKRKSVWHSQISRWETGEHIPSPHHLVQLADFFDIPRMELIALARDRGGEEAAHIHNGIPEG